MPLPHELQVKVRMDRYLTLDRPGWHVLEFGYQAYVQRGPGGDFFVFPGLMVDGARLTKRFHGYKAQVSREAVEAVARATIDYVSEERGIAQEDLNILVHDLRGLSSAIYNSALGAERAITSARHSEAAQLVKSVLAWQGMLKMRTDALDFVGNPASIINTADIPIYRKVDKVVRCFRATADAQSKNIVLTGNSYQRLHGPDIFELIPYILLDNAIKYSPTDQDITVSVRDGESICVSVESIGPKIAEEEMQDIFLKGGRGRDALASGVPGSGVGLHILQKIVDEHFGGSIEVNQEDAPLWCAEICYYRTKFTVTLPPSGSS